MTKPNYSQQRKATVISLLRGARKDASWWGLSDDAKLFYTLGAVICNDAGVVAQSDMAEVTKDPRAVSYARRLMREAGV